MKGGGGLWERVVEGEGLKYVGWGLVMRVIGMVMMGRIGGVKFKLK